MSEPIKTCGTCGHRAGTVTFGRCMLSGDDCMTERKYPTQCGVLFDGWVKRPGLLQRLRDWWST